MFRQFTNSRDMLFPGNNIFHFLFNVYASTHFFPHFRTQMAVTLTKSIRAEWRMGLE